MCHSITWEADLPNNKKKKKMETAGMQGGKVGPSSLHHYRPTCEYEKLLTSCQILISLFLEVTTDLPVEDN